MLACPHRPAKERHPEKLFLCDPAKLKTGQTLNQHRYIYIALMIYDEKIWPAPVETVQTMNSNCNSTQGENQPCPEATNPVDMLSVRIQEPERNSHQRRRHSDYSDERQLQEVEHQDRKVLLRETYPFKTQIYIS